MINLLRQRRSIRQYLDQPIEPEKIDILKEALLRSPSSRNFKPWEFIVVNDKDIIKKLARSKQHGSVFLAGAPLAVIILGDATKSDAWIEDCSIASIIAQFTAQSLGLGSCWVQIRLRQRNENKTSEQYIQELLGIPEHVKVESIIGLGYPAEQKTGIPYDTLSFDKIHENNW
jgi:nitroreductase